MQTHAIILDSDGLRELVSGALLDTLRDHFPALARAATRKTWLTREEVKELTGWSDRTLQNLRDTKQIAFSQHGRKILYLSEEVEAFLMGHKVASRRTCPRP